MPAVCQVTQEHLLEPLLQPGAEREARLVAEAFSCKETQSIREGS